MKKVLIVDDDITLRTALARYLENHGFKVIPAASGVEALALFEQEPPDLVVSDVVMPEMDGFEFCGHVRASQSGQLVPFLFLSSRGEIDDRVQGHHMGADDYLVKPFQLRELMAKIEGQLARSQRIHAEIERLVHQESAETVPSEPLPLTPAEEKVFWQVIQGHTNKQIGDHLFISPRTVQTHLSNILGKLSLENRSQLIRFAFERGYRPGTEQAQKSGLDGSAS